MKNGRIYLVDEENGKLLPMMEQRYEQEVDLQELLSNYPDLIPGDQIDDDRPRRWLLVKAEMGVPGMEEGSDRWSLDHLFLDQDGIPTFVECKRSTDTRIRREVVAQMLDYAANGTEYWPVDRLRQAATETALARGTTVDEALGELLDDAEPETLEAFWEQVAENLAEGRVRLLFVADETPRELRRLVEFLNLKMNDVEALIVEVKQFKGMGQTAVVPRVIGQTEAARTRKRTTAPASRTSLEAIREQSTDIAAQFFKDIVSMAESRGHVLYLGTKGFSLRFYDSPDNDLKSYAYGYPADEFHLYLRDIPLTPEKLTGLRMELMQECPFRKGGEYTLKVEVNAETRDSAMAAYRRMLTYLDEQQAKKE